MAIHQMDPTQNCIEGCGRFLTNTRKKLLPMLEGGGLGFGISILKLLSVLFFSLTQWLVGG